MKIYNQEAGVDDGEMTEPSVPSESEDTQSEEFSSDEDIDEGDGEEV